MKIKYNYLEPGTYYAKLSKIEEKYGKHGPFLRFIFTIEEGDYENYTVAGSVSASSTRFCKLYEWITILLGYEPDEEIDTNCLIGGRCQINVVKNDNNYYVVSDIF